MEITDNESVKMSLTNVTNEEGATCQGHLFPSLVQGQSHLSADPVSQVNGQKAWLSFSLLCGRYEGSVTSTERYSVNVCWMIQWMSELVNE